ncbi:MAG: ATPase, partial [Firmicutes bacterium]|nr:ATPase [Bacillota bacterium]
KITVSELRSAPFDEKLSVMGLILSRLAEAAKNVRVQDELTTALHVALKFFKKKIGEPTAHGVAESPRVILERMISDRQAVMKAAKDAGQLDKETRNLSMMEINMLSDYKSRLVDEDIADADAFEAVKGWFGGQVELRKTTAQNCKDMMDNTFAFLEETFDQSQELVMFVTEITAGHDTSWFVEHFGCDAYFRHNRELLFDETQNRIREQIAAAKTME